MNYDLKMIKKYYGEKMAHLCRSLFPTLLEKEGYLFSLLDSKFARSKFSCDSIIKEKAVDMFQDYIFSLTEPAPPLVDTKKTASSLLALAGYTLYECHTEEEVQSFRPYWTEEESLCTFLGDRLKSCYVFFAVKENAKNLKREKFLNPQRQDEYGTSVISIQFTRGKINVVSIKNRYNHSVDNPDATFHNNLENIIPGLTKAFEQDYGLQIRQYENGFKNPYFVMADDGKFYETLFEDNNIYYGPNNVIIQSFSIQTEFLDKSRYLVMEWLILDMQDKKLYLFDSDIIESLPDYIGEIEKIRIRWLSLYKCKEVYIMNKRGEETFIYVDEKGSIVGFKNNTIKEILDQKFLHIIGYSLVYFEAQNLETIGDHILLGETWIEKFIAPKLRFAGKGFFHANSVCQKLYCPLLEQVPSNFFECMNTEELQDRYDKGNIVIPSAIAEELKLIRQK